MKKNKLYPLQLWLSSVLASPLVIVFIAWLFSIWRDSGFVLGNFGFFWLAWCLGLVFSFPTFVLVQVQFWLIDLNDTPPLGVKIILAVISIIGVWVTFYMLTGAIKELFWIIALYSTSILIASFFYKVEEE